MVQSQNVQKKKSSGVLIFIQDTWQGQTSASSGSLIPKWQFGPTRSIFSSILVAST